MDNAHVSQFINSADIRKYLQDINYQFSVPEYAFLIWQSKNLTVDQRHSEFRLFLESTESCLVKTANCRDGWDLHQTIKDIISLENRLINIFMNREPNSFYVAEWLESGDWHGGNCFFDNYDSAYGYAMQYANNNTIIRFRIKKHYCDNAVTGSSLIEAVYNAEGEMMGINTWGNPFRGWSEEDATLWTERFDDMWFDIPIPFKPGDIVCDCYDKTPFVITDTVPWHRKEHPLRRDTGTIHLGNMDMTASGYSVNSETLTVKYNWLSYYYLNLEYYIGVLKEEDRILKAYSLFKQEKINGDTLLKLSQLITAEHLAKKAFRDIDWMIEDDVAKELGIDKYKEKKRE